MGAEEAIRDAKWTLSCWETARGLGPDPELRAYAKANVKLQIAILEALEKSALAKIPASDVDDETLTRLRRRRVGQDLRGFSLNPHTG